MAWNQPGNNGQDRDPWGSSKPGGNSEGNGNKGGRDQGPPDLDDIFRKLSKKLGGLGGGKGTGSGGGSSSQGPRPQLGGRVVTIAAAAIVIIWAASGFYTIKEAERGVVTRFGKFSHLVEPGLFAICRTIWWRHLKPRYKRRGKPHYCCTSLMRRMCVYKKTSKR